MRERAATVLVAALLVLSGCTLGPGGASVDAGDADPTWDGDQDNPYRQGELVVAVVPPADSDRNFTPLVRQALDYWEANS
jgi:hypothetical protein